jgi:hypothetical protein
MARLSALSFTQILACEAMLPHLFQLEAARVSRNGKARIQHLQLARALALSLRSTRMRQVQPDGASGEKSGVVEEKVQA